MSTTADQIRKETKDVVAQITITSEEHRKELLDFTTDNINKHQQEQELVASIIRKMERFIAAEPLDRLSLVESLNRWRDTYQQGEAVMELFLAGREAIRNYKL